MDFFSFLPLHRQTLCFHSNLSFQVRAKYYVCAKLYNYINYIDLKKIIISLFWHRYRVVLPKLQTARSDSVCVCVLNLPLQ